MIVVVMCNCVTSDVYCMDVYYMSDMYLAVNVGVMNIWCAKS